MNVVFESYCHRMIQNHNICKMINPMMQLSIRQQDPKQDGLESAG